MSDNFDFFKYAGIHRDVVLYTTPRSYVEDISVTPAVAGTTGSLAYSISIVTEGTGTETINVDLVDRNGTTVTTASGDSGNLVVNNARLWWPYTMNASDPGYLYTLKVLEFKKNTFPDIM